MWLQVADAMYTAVHADSHKYFRAFYSSVYGGITTERAFMTIPMDDHMVHRGHGVFDTAMVIDGAVYQLDQHLERLQRSAELARIKLPFGPAKLRRVVLDTAAASRTTSGKVTSHPLLLLWAAHAAACLVPRQACACAVRICSVRFVWCCQQSKDDLIGLMPRPHNLHLQLTSIDCTTGTCCRFLCLIQRYKRQWSPPT
jgi:hypothetical protein